MASLEVRPLDESDRDAVLKLWNRASRHDPIDVRLLNEKVWGDADVTPDLSLVVTRKKRIVGLGVAVPRGTRPETATLKLLAVGKPHRQRGIGRHLVRLLEDRLAAKGFRFVRVGESAPNYLVPGVDVRYADALRLFEDLGYRIIGKAFNMKAEFRGRNLDTTEQESALARDGWSVRRATWSDADGLRALLQQYWPSWIPEVSTALLEHPPTLHVAERNGEIVAFSAYEANNRGMGTFGPMGTAVAARGKGLGSVLSLRCFRDLQASGYEESVIPWVAPTDFYRRVVGAEVSRTFVRLEKKLTR
jgi:predicted N-acetyltransferase YhbS